VNFIDTANTYPAGALPHEVGSSEEITGRWLKDKRGKFILGTKAGGPMGPSAWDRGASRKHLLDEVLAVAPPRSRGFVGPSGTGKTRRTRYRRPRSTAMLGAPTSEKTTAGPEPESTRARGERRRKGPANVPTDG
jgi:hypothetical protein